MDKVQVLKKERTRLREYIQAKLDVDEDYHAIIDAAMDIRDIDAKLQVYNELQYKQPTQKDEDKFELQTSSILDFDWD